MRLSTGFVRSARYDDKVRRILFVLLRDKVPDDEILRAAAEFNRKVFEMIREKGIEKRDVIRIVCEFDIRDGKIIWKWDTLTIEHYEEAQEVGSKMSALLAQIEQQEKLLETFFEKLTNIADRIRDIASEIDSMISDLKRKRELAVS